MSIRSALVIFSALSGNNLEQTGGLLMDLMFLKGKEIVLTV